MTELTKAELDAMIEEATVDCNDEEEQLTVPEGRRVDRCVPALSTVGPRG